MLGEGFLAERPPSFSALLRRKLQGLGSLLSCDFGNQQEQPKDADSPTRQGNGVRSFQYLGDEIAGTLQVDAVRL